MPTILTRSSFNTLKRLFSSSLDDAARAAFAKASPSDQMVKLRAIVPNEMASAAEIAGFVLVFNVKSNIVKAGSPEHYALRKTLGLPDVDGWHKARPPKNAWEMQDSNRVPSWTDESQSMTAIARTLTWDDVRGGPEVLSAAVRAYFRFGGLEDLSDPRAVQGTDATMKIFLEGISYALAILRPDWLDADGNTLKELPQGADMRSQNEIDEERERSEKLKKNEEARERARVRREKELAEYGELRGSILVQFRNDKSEQLAHELSTLEFEDVKAVHEARISKELDATITAIFELLSSRVVLPENAGADEVAEIRHETSLKAAGLAAQLVLEDLNEHQVGWLRRLAIGDLKFVPRPLKGEVRPEGYVSKKEKAAARAIQRIYADYGEEVLNFALKAITGQVLAGPVQVMKMPDWIKNKGGTEEIPVSNETTAMPPPPPPPPPGSVLG